MGFLEGKKEKKSIDIQFFSNFGIVLDEVIFLKKKIYKSRFFVLIEIVEKTPFFSLSLFVLLTRLILKNEKKERKRKKNLHKKIIYFIHELNSQ